MEDMFKLSEDLENIFGFEETRLGEHLYDAEIDIIYTTYEKDGFILVTDTFEKFWSLEDFNTELKTIEDIKTAFKKETGKELEIKP